VGSGRVAPAGGRASDGTSISRRSRSELRTVLGRPGYRRLWAARTVSQAGDVLQFTTLALLVYQLTGRGLGLSGLVLSEIVPVLLLAPIAGPLVDRSSRIRVMVTADVVRAALAAVLAVWHSDITAVYALALGLSAGAVFFGPAANSALPALVEPDEIVAANSGIWSAAVLLQIGLAPAAGALAITVGFGWAFAVNALSFAVSGLLLRRIRLPSASPVAVGRWFTQGAEAMGVLLHDRLLRSLAVAQALAALSAGATSALLVVLAARRLHAAGSGYGLLLAGIGAGAFAGPFLLRRLTTRTHYGLRLLFGALGMRGMVDLVLSLVTSLPAAAGALVLYGLGTSTGNVMFSSLLQTHLPEQLRGRVFAAFDFIWNSMRLLSLLLGGVLADVYGIQAVYVTGGVLLLAAALAGIGTSRSTPFAEPTG